MKKLFVVLFVAALTMLMAGSASADWNSGYPYFYEDGLGNSFNQLAMFRISDSQSYLPSGSYFATPFVTNLNSGWWNYSPSSSVAYAFGPSTLGTTYETFNFTGSPSDGADFLSMVSNGEQVIYRQRLTYNGSSWSYPIIDETEWNRLGGGSPINPNTVPEPVSMTLFLIGGATLAAKRLSGKK